MLYLLSLEHIVFSFFVVLVVYIQLLKCKIIRLLKCNIVQ